MLVTLSEWGGAQHVVYLLAKGLREHYEVTVGCGGGGPLIPRLQAEGVRVVEIPEFCRPPHPVRDLRVLVTLYQWLRRERFTLVHTHSTKAGVLGRLAARWAGAPVVLFTAHGWAFTEGRSAWTRALLTQVERLVARVSDRIVCVSEYDRDLAIRLRVADPETLVTIRNGLDTGEFLTPADAGGIRDTLGAAGDFLIASVGRLAAPKDPFTLISALRMLPDPRSRLLLIGSGSLRHAIERHIRAEGVAERVWLAGERTDVPAILREADVFVHSSHREGLPLVIIEAMLAGLPVVATNIGGIPELVDEGVTGILVPRDDPGALADALRRLMMDPALRRRIGTEGRDKALQAFSHDRMLADYLRLYEELMSRAASGLQDAAS